ncbi:MAG TPA: S1C family serine protease [Solirubrobacteraceae bacterium]|jgi:S1-C subfamily serine protease|nr:S1C family serine protease [Solirubrobacteraceae bacterium]
MSEKLGNTVRSLAASAGPAVVGLGRGARGGSGVIVAEGRALTLARQLRGDEVVVHFGDGREAPARLAGSDGETGVALLTLDSAEVTPVEFATSPPELGSDVFALADPGGRGLRVTAGRVASGPRRLRGPRGRAVGGAIEHTAPMPRGSGGAPLLDEDGRLLGINAARLDGGFILALPAAPLRDRLDDLEQGTATQPRRLGVAILPAGAARRLRRAVGLPERDGLLVRVVQDGSPAARAGVQRGDLLVRLGEQELRQVDDLFAAVDSAPADAPLALSIVRGADELELSLAF